jgi:uncharacterized protein (UPF0332 family)/predicted nucleotidyltransferase
MNQMLQTLHHKQAAMRTFVDRLLRSPVGRNIIKVVHYGSTTRDDWHEESDIDLLIIATGDLKIVETTCSDLSFDVMLDKGELIQPMVYCPDASRHPHYFLTRAQRSGKEIYVLDDENSRKNEAADLLDLASRYARMARSLSSSEDLRGAVDLGYNAAELCVKAFFLLEGEDPPKTHAGIVNRFGELFVKSGKVATEIGRALHRGLEQRNRARYDPHAEMTEEDREKIERLVEGMITVVDQRLS